MKKSISNYKELLSLISLQFNCVSDLLQRWEEVIKFTGTEVTGNCSLLNMGAGNQTLLLSEKQIFLDTIINRSKIVIYHKYNRFKKA